MSETKVGELVIRLDVFSERDGEDGYIVVRNSDIGDVLLVWDADGFPQHGDPELSAGLAEALHHENQYGDVDPDGVIGGAIDRLYYHFTNGDDHG